MSDSHRQKVTSLQTQASKQKGHSFLSRIGLAAVAIGRTIIEGTRDRGHGCAGGRILDHRGHVVIEVIGLIMCPSRVLATPRP